MAGAKETPRQKMIGMMYLVLTALLALNISKEVLNGFVKVENSLRVTQQTMSGKVLDTYGRLQAKYEGNQTKVEPFMTQAKAVKKKADELRSYILEAKARCMASSVGDYEQQEPIGFEKYIGKNAQGQDTILNLKHIKVKDEYMSLTSFMIGSEPQSPREDGEWNARALRTKIEGFRDALKSIEFKDNLGQTRTLPEGIQSTLDKTFEFAAEMEDGMLVEWEAANFYDVPLAAVMPLMSKMSLDVMDSEEDVLAWLLGSVDAKAYKFTNLLPLVIPQSNYILRGDSIRADVLMAAFDATNSPGIFVDGKKWNQKDSTLLETEGLDQLFVGEDGLGKLRISTRGMALGETSYKGLINYKGPNGSLESYPFYTPLFTVAEPALVVSPTKMNVFYRGLPNPVEVSVPGVPQDKIDVRITSGHTIKKQSDGTFVVNPGSGSEAKITVTATLPDGSKKTLPAKDFRVKRIPDPVPSFAGKKPSDRTISKNVLKGAPGVSAMMVGFDFDVTVVVKSFTMSVNRDGTLVERKSSSNRLTSEMKQLIDRVGRGNVVYIEDIVVKMPDGTERQLAPMKLKIT